MSITFPQIKSQGFATSVASYSLAFTSNISSGSIIAVICEYGAVSGQTVTISDTSADVVTDSGLGLFTDFSFGNAVIQAFFAPTAGVAQNITATFSAAPSRAALYIYEIAGLTSASFDKFSSARNSSSSSPDSGPTGALFQAVEAALGVGASQGGDTGAVGSGWTSDGILNAAAGDNAIAMHQVTASTASIDATFVLTTTPDQWLCGVATIKGTVSGGGDTLGGAMQMMMM